MRKAINHLKKSDPVLATIIEKTGPFRMREPEPAFHMLVRSIVGQQLSGKVAATIFSRLKEAAGTEVLTPEAILKLRMPKLRKAGLSQQKATYIRELAKMTREGKVQFDLFPALEDAEIIAQLTAVKGVGVWTAHMFLIFALRRPDVLPVGDLGVRVAIKRAYNLSDLPKPAEMEKIAAAWRPYASFASWYLWRSLENQGMA